MEKSPIKEEIRQAEKATIHYVTFFFFGYFFSSLIFFKIIIYMI